MSCTPWLASLRCRSARRLTRSGRPRLLRRLDFDAVEPRVMMTASAPAGHKVGAQVAATHARPVELSLAQSKTAAAHHPSRGAGVVHALALRQTLGSVVLTSPVVVALNAEIKRQVDTNHLPGAVVEITVPGEQPYIRYQGVANVATGQPRNPADVFRIASITKTFTATAVLQLVDKGLIRKTDVMAKWFPTFPNARYITVDDLLRMRSGIPEAFDPDLAAQYYRNPTSSLTADQVIARAAAKTDQFRPADSATVYTNTNYTILGRIVEMVTGRSLGDQIQRTVLAPLGLSQTSYAIGTAIPGSLRGYSFDPASGKLVDKTDLDPALAGGSGAMVSTVGDLTKYAKALVQGTLLKPKTQAARLTSTPIQGDSNLVQYGEGIEKLGQFVGQNGTIFGFSSEMFYLPALKATIVINVNRSDADDNSESTPLFLALSKIAFPRYVNW